MVEQVEEPEGNGEARRLLARRPQIGAEVTESVLSENDRFGQLILRMVFGRCVSKPALLNFTPRARFFN